MTATDSCQGMWHYPVHIGRKVYAGCTAHFWMPLRVSPDGWIPLDDPKPARGKWLEVAR